MLSYDPILREKLPATNTSGVLLNAAFAEWQKEIAERCDDPQKGTSRYYYSEEKRLFEACKKHAASYNQLLPGNRVVILTHPFYMYLTHMEWLSDCFRTDAKEYLDTMVDFLMSPERRVPIVLFESVFHYAAASSLLLEQGLVDRVIFTEGDGGYPLCYDDLDQLKSKEIYFGGAYNGRCLYHSISAVKQSVHYTSLFGISDLILNSPQDENTELWKPKQVDGLYNSQVVCLEHGKKKWVEYV